MGRNYNYIYKKLVTDESDVLGHIAYAIYKSKKIAFIQQFKDEHDGEEPAEKDLEPFNKVSSLNIEEYKVYANNLLQTFLDNTLKETSKQVEDEIRNNHLELMKEALKSVKPAGFWSGVWQSTLGAIFFAILASVLVFYAKFGETQYTFTIGGNGGAKIEQQQVVVPNDTIIKK